MQVRTTKLAMREVLGDMMREILLVISAASAREAENAPYRKPVTVVDSCRFCGGGVRGGPGGQVVIGAREDQKLKEIKN